jgi:hypothetical protein
LDESIGEHRRAFPSHLRGSLWAMNAVLQEAVIRLGGVEALAEAINARVREIERDRGIPFAHSRASVHPTTVRRWQRGSSSPRYAVVIQAICDVSGRPRQEIWGGDTLDDVDRRQFLIHAMGGLGATALTGGIVPLLADLGAAPDPDPDEYARRASELWHGCWTADPVGLAYAAADHADRGRALLSRSRGRDARRIADAAGLTTILIGRVAFFDLGRERTAEQLWDAAGRYLAGSADQPLLACLYGHMAFVPGWARRWDECAGSLTIARGHARRGGGPGVRSWLYAVAAECLARTGRTQQALSEIERAKETLAAGGAYPDPWWLDYYSLERLAGFDATVALGAARDVLSHPAGQRATRHAIDRVERVLAHLHTSSLNPGDFIPQDCVIAMDRAVAHALIHDDDQALAVAEAACKALSRRPYYAATGRLESLSDLLPSSRLGQLHEIERTYLGAA